MKIKNFLSYIKSILIKKNRQYSSKLYPGDTVEVRSHREIISTLDKSGTVEGLLFIPEMHKYCEKKFEVKKIVNKIIIEGAGLIRYMKNTVILNEVTCDGEAHENCGRNCPLLWKEIWLRRLDNKSKKRETVNDVPYIKHLNNINFTHSNIVKCQSTNLINATFPLHIWDIRKYIWDITGKTYTPIERIRTIMISLFLKIFKLISGKRYPIIHGKLKKTTSAQLYLQKGDIVEVKSKKEILATLDVTGRNKGLEFTPEMLKFCGNRFRVLKRLDKMINEITGEMQHLSNTVILEGTTCDGKAHGGCQRNCYCFWREIWLKKI